MRTSYGKAAYVAFESARMVVFETASAMPQSADTLKAFRRYYMPRRIYDIDLSERGQSRRDVFVYYMYLLLVGLWKFSALNYYENAI